MNTKSIKYYILRNRDLIHFRNGKRRRTFSTSSIDENISNYIVPMIFISTVSSRAITTSQMTTSNRILQTRKAYAAQHIDVAARSGIDFQIENT